MIRDLLKFLYHALRRALEWLLHPLRRRRSLALASRAAPASVLFVCHGNICRSPYAEFAARAMLPDGQQARVRVESAGFFGPDRPSPPEAHDAAGARGVDLSPHRSKLLTADMVAEMDLVVVMEAKQRTQLLRDVGRPRGPVVLLGEFDPDRGQPRTIPDPIGMPLSVFTRTYDRIDRCLQELVRAMTASGQSLPRAERGDGRTA